MVGWLKRKMLTAASKSQEKELRAQIQRLKGMSSEEIGFLLAGSTLVRKNLTSGGALPPESLDLSMPRDEFEMEMVPIKLGTIIRQFQKSGQPSDAAFTMTWLHSTRALCNLDIRVFEREMWAELSRGFPYARQGLHQIELELGKSSKVSDQDLKFIPVGLEPL